MGIGENQGRYYLMINPSDNKNTASAEWAFARYEQVQSRLPRAGFPRRSQLVGDLSDLTDEIDMFLLDAFGVLNVGETPIPKAVERINQLQSMGKKICVLTNSASFSTDRSIEKFKKLGFEFSADQIISSRDAALAGVKKYASDMIWGVATTAIDQLEEFGIDWHRLEDNPALYDKVDGFLFLSSGDWTGARQKLLLSSLRKKTRPFVIGNPDIVAPHEDGLSYEPGSFAHDLADETGVVPDFFGKPFANIFDLTLSRDNIKDMAKNRIAMVGDTLHTDILGGAAAGLKTVLITDHGLLKGQPIESLIARSGIVPDFIAPTT